MFGVEVSGAKGLRFRVGILSHNPICTILDTYYRGLNITLNSPKTLNPKVASTLSLRV